MYFFTAELAKLRIDDLLRDAEQARRAELARRATGAHKTRARRGKRERLRLETAAQSAAQEG